MATGEIDLGSAVYFAQRQTALHHSAGEIRNPMAAEVAVQHPQLNGPMSLLEIG